MPRNDQMGPQGFGPMTGRKMGRCNGQEDLMRLGKGNGRAVRRCNSSFKMGRGRQLFTQFNDLNAKDLLIQRQQQLQAELQAIDLELENL